MSETLTLQPSASCVISEVPEETDKNMHTSMVQSTEDYRRYLLLKYEVPEEYWYNNIVSVDISAPFSSKGMSLTGRLYFGGIERPFDANGATYENVWGTLIGDSIKDIYYSDTTSPVEIDVERYFLLYWENGLYLSPSWAYRDYSGNLSYLEISAAPALKATFTGSTRFRILSYMEVNGVRFSFTQDYANPTKFDVDTTQPINFNIQTNASSGRSLVEPVLEKVKFLYLLREEGWQTLYFDGGVFSISGDTMQYILDNMLGGYIEVTPTSSSGISGNNPCYIKPVAKPKPFISFSPAGGAFVDRRKDYTFSFQPNAGVTGDYFNYRLSTASEYTTIALDGATKYTLPADTITVGADYVFYWQVHDRYGVEYDSEQMTFTTLESISTAAPVSPSGGIEDIDNPVAFIWTHTISTGSPQTKADLQISADGAEWTELATVEGAETMYTLPAKGLAVGTWYWRVRTYNLDGIAGEWSAAAQFLAVGSPPTPVLNIVDASPRPTIAWQVTDQEAWELTIDGATETNYGTGKRWTSPRYLEDGQHTVSVRVQNKYGRWSNPGSLIVEVQNVPGAAINLTVETGEGAALTWYGSYDFYLVERGGVPIARTTETEYTDLLSVGLCTYQVRGCYADSYNYGLSNLVEVDILPDVPVLIDIKSRDILRLPLSEQQHRTWAWSRSVSVNSYHVAGRALPSVDVGEYTDESLSGSVSFDEEADIRRFNGMLGRLVCLKTDGGDMAIGILTALNKSRGLFYATYNIAVTAADYEEEIRLD